jgi:hypothetical protein
MSGFIWFKNWSFLLFMASAFLAYVGVKKWVGVNSHGIGVSNELAPVHASNSISNDSLNSLNPQKINQSKQLISFCEEAILRQAGNQIDASSYCNCALPVFSRFLNVKEIKLALEGIPSDKVPKAAYNEIQSCLEGIETP